MKTREELEADLDYWQHQLNADPGPLDVPWTQDVLSRIREIEADLDDHASKLACQQRGK